MSLSKNINPSLVLVQPRKTRPFITERLLMGRKESNQTNKQTNHALNICLRLVTRIPQLFYDGGNSYMVTNACGVLNETMVSDC